MVISVSHIKCYAINFFVRLVNVGGDGPGTNDTQGSISTELIARPCFERSGGVDFRYAGNRI